MMLENYYEHKKKKWKKKTQAKQYAKKMCKQTYIEMWNKRFDHRILMHTKNRSATKMKGAKKCVKETHKQNLHLNICKQNLDIKLIKKLLMKETNKHEIFQDQNVDKKRPIVCQNWMSHKIK